MVAGEGWMARGPQWCAILRPWPLSLAIVSQVLMHSAGEGMSMSSEEELLRSLQGRGVDADAQEELQLLRTCVAKSWWTAAKAIVARTHKRSVAHELESVRAEITTLTSNMKQQADEFAAFSAATFRGQTQGLDEVHCAMQWAQNDTHIFLGVKYATRWSAPGAIEIVDLSVKITPSAFELEGFGHHSSIRKRYTVELPLFADADPERSSWSAASVGRMTATICKAKAERWPRLTKSKGKSKHQITSWLDMEERWAAKQEPVKKSEQKKSGGKHKDKATKEPTQPPQSSKSSSTQSSGKEKGQRLHVPWRKKLLRWWRHAVPRLQKALPYLLLVGGGLTLALAFYLWQAGGTGSQVTAKPTSRLVEAAAAESVGADEFSEKAVGEPQIQGAAEARYETEVPASLQHRPDED
eukprot:TRINITY_DN47565_c0_g1_i1.p1 TRINITY_DN47565_c0_g1~~TRINITY_DN47565_c0_g1_i1.p1  ORF type:complete len:411 (-),score=68.27 TRINITY_DN47565_c0_g1_i1:19-1251(-)